MLYGYVSNFPINYIDRLGLAAKMWNARSTEGCDPDEVDKKAREILRKAVKIMNDANLNPKRHEYYGSICCNCKTKQIVVTGPFQGATFRTKQGGIVQEQEYSPLREAKCPRGTKVVGYYHTHPDGANPSQNDIEMFKGSTTSSYVSKDGENIYRIDPQRKVPDEDNIVMPGGMPAKPAVIKLK